VSGNENHQKSVSVAAKLPDLQAAHDEKILPADYRREFVFAHGIA
jgi:hypothetical protein